jgi:hypothetical protein
MQTRKLKVTKPIVLALVGIICASALWASEAWAIKLLSKNDPVAVSFTDTDRIKHVVLTKSINLNKKGPVMIMYTAECLVNSSQIDSYLSIEILIDGAVIPPTGTDFAFCSPNGQVAGGWIGAAAQVKKILTPGSHTIEIVGQAQNVDVGRSMLWRIDDQVMNIIIQKN